MAVDDLSPSLKRGEDRLPDPSDPAGVQSLSLLAWPSNKAAPYRVGPELGHPGCLIRGSAGHARKLPEKS